VNMMPGGIDTFISIPSCLSWSGSLSIVFDSDQVPSNSCLQYSRMPFRARYGLRLEKRYGREFPIQLPLCTIPGIMVPV
jgi:hypothetical protein